MAQIVKSDYGKITSANNLTKSFRNIVRAKCFSVIPFAYIIIFNITISQ